MHKLHYSLRYCLFIGFLACGMQTNARGSPTAETGLLWRAESPQGRASYLFGTMHSDDERINHFSREVQEALAQAETFVMEVLPPGDQSAHLMLDQKLDALLNANESAQVIELARTYGLSEELALRMKPWLLAMVLEQPHMQTPYTQDLQLFALARQLGKKAEAVEAANEHYNLLDDLSLHEQLLILRHVLRRSQEDKQRDFDLLLETYMRQNLAAIAQVNETMNGVQLPKGLWQKMRVKLIDERNSLMADRLAEKGRAQALFVAVGAAHLPGKKGMIALLREAGYRVTPIPPTFGRPESNHPQAD